MNYVESLDILGEKAKQIPCIVLHGHPTTSTEGAVGVLGLDVDSPGHDLYKCVGINNGSYVWEIAVSNISDFDAKVDERINAKTEEINATINRLNESINGVEEELQMINEGGIE